MKAGFRSPWLILLALIGAAVVVVYWPRADPIAAEQRSSQKAARATAEEYRSAWRMLDPDAPALDHLGYLNFQVLRPRLTGVGYDEGRMPLWPELESILRKHRVTIERLVAASGRESCIFDADPMQQAGSDRVDEDCAWIERSVLILRADAARLAGEGEIDTAIGRLAAIFGLIAHAAYQHEPRYGDSLLDLIGFGTRSLSVFVDGLEPEQLTEARIEALQRAPDPIDGSTADMVEHIQIQAFLQRPHVTGVRPAVRGFADSIRQSIAETRDYIATRRP